MTTSVVSSGRRRRRLWQIFCCLLCALFLLAILVLVLALTVFRVHDPTSEVVSTRVSGVSPRITFPAISVQLNVSLALDVLVHNPNRAVFSHPAPGHSQLLYRGAQVGDAELEPGRIPSRGSEHLQVALTLEVDRLAGELGQLVSDIMAGAVEFEVKTRLPGRVTLLGFIKHHAVATSDCHLVVGFPDLKVRSTECTDKTKL